MRYELQSVGLEWTSENLSWFRERVKGGGRGPEIANLNAL